MECHSSEARLWRASLLVYIILHSQTVCMQCTACSSHQTTKVYTWKSVDDRGLRTMNAPTGQDFMIHDSALLHVIIRKNNNNNNIFE